MYIFKPIFFTIFVKEKNILLFSIFFRREDRGIVQPEPRDSSNLRYTVCVTGSRARTVALYFLRRDLNGLGAPIAACIRRGDTTGLENGIDIIRSPRRRLTQQQFRFEQFRFVVTKICQWFASSRPAHFLYTFPSVASLRLASIVNIIPPPRPRLLQGCATVAERELPPPDTRGSPVTKSRLCSTYVFRDA